MDLSFTRFDVDAEPIAMPHDLAVLMVGIAARPAASPTAAAQAGVNRGTPDPRPFAPVDGAFNGATASAIAGWREDEEDVHHGVSADLQRAGGKPGDDTGEQGADAPREV